MNRRLTAAFVAAAAVAASATTALALKNEQFQGKPAEFTPGKLNTAVWHDEDGIHLRFSTAGKVDRVYSGKVCAEKILKADRVELEDADKVSVDGICVVFEFKTDGAVDGIDLRAEGAAVTFDLQIDGHAIPKSDIFIGKDGVHPKQTPFVMNRM